MAFLSTPLDTFHSTPPATRAFVILVAVCSVGYQYYDYHHGSALPYLLLVPGSWIWYPWTILSSVLFEISFLEVIEEDS